MKKIIIEIMKVEYKLEGNWKAGWALDLHTISSVKNANGGFDNTYTDIGYALNQLKYHHSTEKLNYLGNQLVKFMNTRMVTPYLDVILPVPPSNQRDIQPVYEIASLLAKGVDKKIDFNFLLKNRSTSQLKSMQDPQERERELSGVFSLKNPTLYQGKKILLVDDLYRSGSTLKEITRVLYEQGKVSNVYVVTLTKTRVNR
ncbi:ComF family protein [Acinetobacter soli]|uniref:ComF family protein n=1 Tax=Acinetobacter soli TaxID=487316 RepID=UPI000DD043D6|nr:phosphoribosyltransferase family protein [Acinetobacter soli]